MNDLLNRAYKVYNGHGLQILIRKATFELFRNIPISTKYKLHLTSKWFRARRVLFKNITSANELRSIRVDPDQIVYYHYGGPQELGWVVDGDWDQVRHPFDDCIVYQSIKQRIEEDVEWEETTLYSRYLDEEVDPQWDIVPIRSEGEFRSYTSDIDQLIEVIRKEGYKSQSQLLSENASDVFRKNNDAIHPVLNEVGVNIYRDGSMAKVNSGTHRLAIAKVLGLDTIPVIIRVRHKKWEETRHQVAEAKTIHDLRPEIKSQLDHPDLENLINGNMEE